MRRQNLMRFIFAATAATFVLLSGAGCKSNQSPSTPPTSGGQNFTGSVSQDHSHTVTIQRTEVESPPAAGISRQTSSSQAHTHTFTMTQAQLQAVKDGQTIRITDSLVSGHTHEYQIQKWF